MQPATAALVLVALTGAMTATCDDDSVCTAKTHDAAAFLQGSVGLHRSNVDAHTRRPQAPKLALMTRSYAGAAKDLLAALPCHDLSLLGSTQLIYVLDDTPADRSLGHQIQSYFVHRPQGQVIVVYEGLPACSDKMFLGRLEGTAGKDRSQYSLLIHDKYTDAEMIGFFDAEVCFRAPVAASYYLRGDVVHLMPISDNPQGDSDHWGVDAWALNMSAPYDFMAVDRFPLFVKTKHLAEVRRHLVRRFASDRQVWADTKRDCAWDSEFDMAFSRITSSPKRWSFHRHARPGFCTFNMMLTYVVFKYPEEYKVHTGTYDLLFIPANNHHSTLDKPLAKYFCCQAYHREVSRELCQSLSSFNPHDASRPGVGLPNVPGRLLGQFHPAEGGYCPNNSTSMFQRGTNKWAESCFNEYVDFLSAEASRLTDEERKNAAGACVAQLV